MNVCILSDLNGKIELSGCEMKNRKKTHVITLSYGAKTKREHNFKSHEVGAVLGECDFVHRIQKSMVESKKMREKLCLHMKNLRIESKNPCTGQKTYEK